MVALDVVLRDQKKSPEVLRASGVLPAVIYGSKEKSTPISVPMQAFERVWKEAGETTVIVLKGLDDEKQTLIHEVQFHPVTGRALHADFYAIEKGQKVEVAVPLEFTGVAPAEKAGHVVVKALHEIEIEVEPSELPHSLIVDISSLEKVGDHITVGDIKLPKSAILKDDPKEFVVTVAVAKEEKIETSAPVATIIEGEETASAEGAAPGAEGAGTEPAKEGKEKTK